jgi:hypothetical protein
MWKSNAPHLFAEEPILIVRILLGPCQGSCDLHARALFCLIGRCVCLYASTILGLLITYLLLIFLYYPFAYFK